MGVVPGVNTFPADLEASGVVNAARFLVGVETAELAPELGPGMDASGAVGFAAGDGVFLAMED